MSENAKEKSASHWYFIGLILFTAYVFYGALFPWQGWTLPSVTALDVLLAEPRYPTTQQDIIQNLLFFLPIGLCFAFWWRHKKLLLTFFVCMIYAATLSTSIELLQAYLPQRVPAVSDIVLNIISANLGCLLGWLWVRIKGLDWCEHSMHKMCEHNFMARVCLMLFIACLFYEWHPLIPSLNWHHMTHNITPALESYHQGNLHLGLLTQHLGAFGTAFLLLLPVIKLKFYLFIACPLTLLLPLGKVFLLSHHLFLEALVAWGVIAGTMCCLFLLFFCIDRTRQTS